MDYYHHSFEPFFFYIPPEMKWSISDDDNLKTVEGGRVGWVDSMGFDILLLFSSTIRMDVWWIRLVKVSNNAMWLSRRGGTDQQNLFASLKNNPLAPSPPPLVTGTISTSHYCNCDHSKWSKASIQQAANCIRVGPYQSAQHKNEYTFNKALSRMHRNWKLVIVDA